MHQPSTADFLASDAPPVVPDDPDGYYDEDFQGDHDFGCYFEWRDRERRHALTGRSRLDARPGVARRRGRAPRLAGNTRRRGSRRGANAARGDPDSDEPPGGRLALIRGAV